MNENYKNNVYKTKIKTGLIVNSQDNTGHNKPIKTN